MRNIEIVELLLDKGAKVSAVDKVGVRNIDSQSCNIIIKINANTKPFQLFIYT